MRIRAGDGWVKRTGAAFWIGLGQRTYRCRVVIFLAALIPAFRLTAIAYGLLISGSGTFVPLLGDTWGASEAIQQISAGRVFPMGDPTNASETLLIYPPGYFVLVSGLSQTTGLSVPFSIQLLGLFIDFVLALIFYSLARRFLARRHSRFALILLMLPGSLVWIRTLPLVLDPRTVSAVLSGILEGAAKLAIPQATKDQVSLILYSGHGALYDAMQMGYEWLAHSFGLLSVLLVLRGLNPWARARIVASGVTLGMVNLVHPYALFGWDLLFACGLALCLVRRKRAHLQALSVTLLIAFLVSSFYTVPVVRSLMAGGSASDILSAVSGDLPWGMYNPQGRIRFPDPLRLLEVRGVSFILALAGLALLARRRALSRFSIPIGMLALGFMLGPVPVALGVKSQLLARQEVFIFLAVPFIASYFLMESLDRLRADLKGRMRVLPRVALATVLVLLIVPKAIGFGAYTIRWIPKSNVMHPSISGLIHRLGEQEPGSIYAPRDISVKIGALTHHVVPLGFVSTFTSKTWDGIITAMTDERIFFHESTDWDEMSSILRKQEADLLLTPRSLADSKSRILSEHLRLLSSIGSYQIWDTGTPP